MSEGEGFGENDVAIVGMAARVPGADDPDEFWRHVEAGDDCLSDLGDEQLAAAGVDQATFSASDYVKRSGMMRDVAGFDAEFFGIGARDGAIMDPQHRHFLECAWEALEAAAIVPSTFDGAIGVFGGSGMNTYLLNNLITAPNLLDDLGWFLLRHTGNDKDFLVNNVAYRLNLSGPAVNVQTACSTSLVAVHLAVQSLLSFECDAALAGGATIEVPHGVGYEFREGEILSPDGRCRAFDAQSAGTVLTSGVGMVALRRAVDAEESGEPILAIIRGTAINNDGSRKVSFLAPSVDGHADVVREALTVAEVDAADIGLVDAHGTGTAVGDPIEVAALTEAFRSFTDATSYCRLTSTKPNIGHLDTAAGVASLIKVVQALRHRTLPPLANHTGPSPLLDLERSPFTLSGAAEPWQSTGIRRAGVSSLGVGGTNAHAVLEEAPDRVAPTEPTDVPATVPLVLSAQTSGALDDAAKRLADRLDGDNPPALGAVAHTLLRGRSSMPHRRVVTVANSADAIELLRSGDRHLVHSSHVGDETPRVGFMFPGGGSQYPGMGAGLDDRFDVFHDVRRQGIEAVLQAGGPDLGPLFEAGGDAAALQEASASLPAVFLTSLALARQCIAMGAEPGFFLGHSLGEYVAAHLAGVMSFDDVVGLVVVRSRLMQDSAGTDAAMMAVPLSEEQLREVVPESLSIATINAADECVVAGRLPDIESFGAVIADLDAPGTLIPLSAAAHSFLLDPVLDEFHAAVQAVSLNAPTERYLSNLTGTWIEPKQATDARYWVDHLRGTVRFHDCLSTVLEEGPTVLVELGPGQGLSSYARRSRPRPVDVIPTLRHPDHEVADSVFTMQAFARLWTSGSAIDIESMIPATDRHVVLPTYPFQHEHRWIEPGVRAARPAGGSETSSAPKVLELPTRIESVDDATWVPTWTPTTAVDAAAPTGSWVVAGDPGDPYVDQLVAELSQRGADAAVWNRRDDSPVLESPDGTIVVVASSDESYEAATKRWLDDATSLVSAAGLSRATFVALTRNALAVDGPARRPADAMALGAVLVAPREYPGLSTRMVDAGPTTSLSGVVDALVEGSDQVIAVREGVRMTIGRERVALAAPSDQTPSFRSGGRYLVTGGLGGVGHVLATHLVRDVAADVVVVASAAVPEGAERERWVEQHAVDDPTSRRIRQLAELESFGTDVSVVVADLSDAAAVRAALDAAGDLDGVIHAAGVVNDRLLEMASPSDHRFVTDVKAGGALVLADELESRGVELLVLVSSTSTVLAPAGQTGYVAANSVLDALAGTRGSMRITTMNYGLWADVGIASASARRSRLGLGVGTEVRHPIFSERIDGIRESVEFVGRLDAAHHWIIDEHRTSGGVAVLPATGHVELMTAALALAGRATVAFEGLAFLSPLVVDDDQSVLIRVVIDPASKSIRLESDGGTGDAWLVHSEATLNDVGEVPAIEVRSSTGDLSVMTNNPLDRLRRHLLVGERWSVVESAEANDSQASASLVLGSSLRDDIELWRAHPGMMDAAVAVGVALGATDDDMRLFVPVGIGAVHSIAPVLADATVTVHQLDGSSDELLRLDVTVSQTDGSTSIQIHDLQLLPVEGEQSLERAGAAAQAAEVTTLLDAADVLGLRADDGVALMDRLVASAHARVIGSSIDLDDLERWMEAAALADADELEDSPGGGVGAASVEDAVRSMWQDLLGVDDVGDDDDFFDLGGHSLIAIRLLSRVGRDLGVRLQLSDLFDASTVSKMSDVVRNLRPELEDSLATAASAVSATDAPTPTVAVASTAEPATVVTSKARKSIVTISSSGDRQPLFVVHGAGGGVLFLSSFARSLRDRPVFGFEATGTRKGERADTSVRAMAERYADELLADHEGPYLIGGYSGGGMVALEMVEIIRAAGGVVEQVILFDSVPPGKAMPGRTTRWKRMIKHAASKGVSSIAPYLHALLSRRLDIHLLGAQEAVDAPDDDDFIDLFDHFSLVANQHVVGRYAVDVLLARADHVWPIQPDDYHWTPHVEGKFETVNVPGDHLSMFSSGLAATLAERVAPSLSEAASVDDGGAGESVLDESDAR